MTDLGFEPGMIAELTGVPRGTVNDIIFGNGNGMRMAIGKR
jgi:hypothetical protein